ncbi:MAG: DUF3995 domain-containing protein [Acidobacteriota bacterium]|nr:DUF3995 domain-containing protein [Acidobacteriota bacterium]
MKRASKAKVAVGMAAGYGAALWALIFAFLHVVWAAGWYIGLPAEKMREAFQKTWFLVYDLIAAGMCTVAVPLALALTRQWGRQLPVRLLVFVGWSVTGILALRGVAGVIKIAYLAAIGENIANPLFLWDFWFCLGAALFGLSTWNFRRASINANGEKP